MPSILATAFLSVSFLGDLPGPFGNVRCARRARFTFPIFALFLLLTFVRGVCLQACRIANRDRALVLSGNQSFESELAKAQGKWKVHRCCRVEFRKYLFSRQIFGKLEVVAEVRSGRHVPSRGYLPKTCRIINFLMAIGWIGRCGDAFP